MKNDTVNIIESLETLNKDEFLSFLESYLEDRKESTDESWARTDKQDISDIYAIFGKILDLKFANDYQGYRPIKFILMDRNFHDGNFCWEPVEKRDYSNDELNLKNSQNRLRALSMNASIANSQLDSEVRFISEKFRKMEI